MLDTHYETPVPNCTLNYIQLDVSSSSNSEAEADALSENLSCPASPLQPPIHGAMCSPRQTERQQSVESGVFSLSPSTRQYQSSLRRKDTELRPQTNDAFTTAETGRSPWQASSEYRTSQCSCTSDLSISGASNSVFDDQGNETNFGDVTTSHTEKIARRESLV
jgi:hypothetical protein